MMRTILMAVVIGAAAASAGCGSSKGDGTPTQLPEPAGQQDPAVSSTDPAVNPDKPTGNPDKPTGNPDQPAKNPDRPGTSSAGPGSGTRQGAGGTGGSDNHPGGDPSCTSVCASLQGCADACTKFCSNSPDVVPVNCTAQATAIRNCATQAGITCGKNKIVINGDACKAEISAFTQCSQSAATGM